jgi:hypothetical protein
MSEFTKGGIALLIPSDGRKVSIEFCMSLPALGYPVGTHRFMFMNKKDPAKLQTRAAQRETLLEKSVAIGAEFSMWIDDDTVCPPETIQELFYVMAQHPEAGIVGGIYCTKTVPPQPIVFMEFGAGPHWRWTIGDVFPCKGLGTGCMMVRNSIMAKIPKPWFQDTSESQSGVFEERNGVKLHMIGTEGTDDVYFCAKVLAAGYDVVAHGGVLPFHQDQDGKFYQLPRDSYPVTSYIAKMKAAGTPVSPIAL